MASHTTVEGFGATGASQPLLSRSTEEPELSRPQRARLFIVAVIYLLFAIPASICGVGGFMLFNPTIICQAVAVAIWALAAFFVIGAIVLLRQAFKPADASWKAANTAMALPFVGSALIVLLMGIHMLYFSGGC